ncbi:hypothetical protein SUGI_0670220 [Cryptomeria japonica]|nr:hypothetical protein SUGI_0670220 [Cryptomeria japonica]
MAKLREESQPEILRQLLVFCYAIGNKLQILEEDTDSEVYSIPSEPESEDDSSSQLHFPSEENEQSEITSEESSSDEERTCVIKPVHFTSWECHNKVYNDEVEFIISEVSFICEECGIKEKAMCLLSQRYNLTYHPECLIAALRKYTRSNNGVSTIYEEIEEYIKQRHIKEQEQVVPILNIGQPSSQWSEFDKSITEAFPDQEMETDLQDTLACDLTEKGKTNLNNCKISCKVKVPFDKLQTALLKEVCSTNAQALKARRCISGYNASYIAIGFSFPGYKPYTLHAYVDSGAGMSIALKHALPKDLWHKVPADQVLTGNTINNMTVQYDTVALNVPCIIAGELFIIPAIWQTLEHDSDILLGQNFLLAYQPFTQSDKTIMLTRHKQEVYLQRRTTALSVAFIPFLHELELPESPQTHDSPSDVPSSRSKPGGFWEASKFKKVSFQPSEKASIPKNITLLTPRVKLYRLAYTQQERTFKQCSEMIHKVCLQLNLPRNITLEDIKAKLKDNIGENPLALWENDKARCHLKLLSEHTIIRVRPLDYPH